MLTSNELMQIYLKKDYLRSYVQNGKNGGYIWGKARWYTCIVYPEHWDSKEDMLNDIKSIGFPLSLSPLHDSDLTDDGELKKAHYHLVVYWSGQCTPYRAYTYLCGCLGENSIYGVEVGGNGNKLTRYHTHIDYPEKAQYNFNDIIAYNGMDIGKYYKEGMVSDTDTVKKIKEIIKERNILFFNELDEILCDEYPTLYDEFVCNRNVARHIKDYIKGREYQMFYDGEIERSQRRFSLPDGSEKVIFNRQIKVV